MAGTLIADLIQNSNGLLSQNGYQKLTNRINYSMGSYG